MTKSKPPVGYLPPHLSAGLAPDVPLGVALSGGADSVALLHLLHQHHAGPLHALHVHHGIRGAEADRDAAFCRALCESLAVPFTVLYADVPALAAARGLGLETAARDARYEALGAYLAAHHIPLLATAHHADDQLETILQNLLRGAGRRGLCGIPAVRPLQKDGEILLVRPLLQMTKQQILDYCAAHTLAFVTDSTNDEPCCPRNRLRAEVIPVLRELWPAGAIGAARCAATLAEDEKYLQSLAADFLAGEGREPRVSALAALPRPILVRVMQLLLPQPPQAAHIEALAALLQNPRPHAALCLPGCRVQLEQGRLTVCTQAQDACPPYEMPLVAGETQLPYGIGLAVLAPRGADVPVREGYRHAVRVDFNSAAANGTLLLRNRRAGDRILAGKCHKSVRKLPCMAQFSKQTRARMPLLCDGAGVLAVPCGPLRDGAKKNADSTLYLFFN